MRIDVLPCEAWRDGHLESLFADGQDPLFGIGEDGHLRRRPGQGRPDGVGHLGMAGDMGLAVEQPAQFRRHGVGGSAHHDRGAWGFSRFPSSISWIV